MPQAASLMLFNLALIAFAIGFGLVALIGGHIRLTRSRTLRGAPARFAGLACVVLALAFWRYSAQMWSLLDY
jgi:hypothetical protein